jgi:hypothetical protein
VKTENEILLSKTEQETNQVYLAEFKLITKRKKRN